MFYILKQNFFKEELNTNNIFSSSCIGHVFYQLRYGNMFSE